MDTLSIILTVIECLIVVAVVVSSAIALSKLSKALVFLPGSMKHVGGYLLGALMIIGSVLIQISDSVSRNIHMARKWFMFSCRYLRFSLASDCRTVTKNITSCVSRAGSFIFEGLSVLKHPLIRYDSGGKISSQSFATISQVILQ